MYRTNDRALWDGYDRWKTTPPDYYDAEVVTRGVCDLDGADLGVDHEVETTEVEKVNEKGKKVIVHYARCPECAEYLSQDSNAEDLAMSVGDGDVILDEHGKYKGSKVRWEEQEPEDTRDDEDMGRYRDDY